MMFQTQIGASEDSSATVYLRPETAQGMFVNFKNVVDSFHPKLPFGLAQIGKAFRNEITPRDFIFRVREFEQMEIEYFIREEEWQKEFEYWKDEMIEWMQSIGIDMNHVYELEVAPEDLAHYSKRTVDFEFDFPFGKKELFGLAYRTDFDLKNHKLEYQDEETKAKIVPHVIEPTFGVDRAILALLTSAYMEDDSAEETRVYLKFKPSVAPVICAVSPLLKNKPELVEKARFIYGELKAEFGRVMFDDNGNIGKRYRRQDEIGTPYCITIDFDTITDGTVTVRDRDTGTQERIHERDLAEYITKRI
jgi:glycyl-tRNA synthetase